jgi:pimeloyl-ACP methyl ester carboxylesterase
MTAWSLRSSALMLASAAAAALSLAPDAGAQTLAGVECRTPPPSHCEETCTSELLGELGNAVEPSSGRAFFLDFPCDLASGDPYVFILSLHGAGSIGNWQRHYFPALDYEDRYRLVIATPTAAGSGSIGGGDVRMWTSEADDAYLRNIVDLVLERFGRENVRSFWLAGHSQGGMTANRLVCSSFFRDKVDGWLSLSGGRIGQAEIAPDFFGPDGPPAALASDDSNAPRPGAALTPDCAISYIFATGEHEIVALPNTSPLAERYGCAARERRADIVDEQKGYVSAARPGRGASWGREARPGTAEVFVYPNCAGGGIVADVLRMDKGHTEGLEPHVTEALVRMMTDAPGGKIAAGG